MTLDEFNAKYKDCIVNAPIVDGHIDLKGIHNLLRIFITESEWHWISQYFGGPLRTWLRNGWVRTCNNVDVEVAIDNIKPLALTYFSMHTEKEYIQDLLCYVADYKTVQRLMEPVEVEAPASVQPSLPDMEDAGKGTKADIVSLKGKTNAAAAAVTSATPVNVVEPCVLNGVTIHTPMIDGEEWYQANDLLEANKEDSNTTGAKVKSRVDLDYRMKHPDHQGSGAPPWIVNRHGAVQLLSNVGQNKRKPQADKNRRELRDYWKRKNRLKNGVPQVEDKGAATEVTVKDGVAPDIRDIICSNSLKKPLESEQQSSLIPKGFETLSREVPVFEDPYVGKVCDARHLHAYLKVGRDFSTWIKGRIAKYQFVENRDFVVFPQSGEKSEKEMGRPMMQYHITVAMASELCMLENNERGQMARKYFRESAAMLKAIVSGAVQLPVEQKFERLLERFERRIEEKIDKKLSASQETTQELENEVQEQKHTIAVQDLDIRILKMTVTEQAEFIRRSKAILRSSSQQATAFYANKHAGTIFTATTFATHLNNTGLFPVVTADLVNAMVNWIGMTAKGQGGQNWEIRKSYLDLGLLTVILSEGIHNGKKTVNGLLAFSHLGVDFLTQVFLWVWPHWVAYGWAEYTAMSKAIWLENAKRKESNREAFRKLREQNKERPTYLAQDANGNDIQVDGAPEEDIEDTVPPLREVKARLHPEDAERIYNAHTAFFELHGFVFEIKKQLSSWKSQEKKKNSEQ